MTADTSGPPPVPGSRRAVVVRGGWEGHEPVKTTDFLMHPPCFSDHTVRILPERADHPLVAGLADLDVPEVRALTERGLLWASR